MGKGGSDENSRKRQGDGEGEKMEWKMGGGKVPAALDLLIACVLFYS